MRSCQTRNVPNESAFFIGSFDKKDLYVQDLMFRHAGHGSGRYTTRITPDVRPQSSVSEKNICNNEEDTMFFVQCLLRKCRCI